MGEWGVFIWRCWGTTRITQRTPKQLTKTGDDNDNLWFYKYVPTTYGIYICEKLRRQWRRRHICNSQQITSVSGLERLQQQQLQYILKFCSIFSEYLSQKVFMCTFVCPSVCLSEFCVSFSNRSCKHLHLLGLSTHWDSKCCKYIRLKFAMHSGRGTFDML